jgi:DNA polymerase-4
MIQEPLSHRKILHFDLDCFYAAVEVKYEPALRGKPLGIGGPPNSRSVLCTASYEARAFGVRAAMPSSRAVRLCPQLILRPPDFQKYKLESREIHQIFSRYTDRIEPLSLDEAYLDVTQIATRPGEATEIAREIKEAVWKERELRISAGAAPNKFLAKIASDWKKPNGLFVIPPQKVDVFVRDLPVDRIFGVGKVTAEKLHGLGIQTCGDLQKFELLELKRLFGSRAMDLYHLARGRDDREVVANWERKSLTVEETFATDIADMNQILSEAESIYLDWKARFHRSQEPVGRIGGAVIKLKYHDFKQTTHECSLRGVVPELAVFQQLISQTWMKRPEAIRLLGLGVRLVSGETSQQTSFL